MLHFYTDRVFLAMRALYAGGEVIFRLPHHTHAHLVTADNFVGRLFVCEVCSLRSEGTLKVL